MSLREGAAGVRYLQATEPLNDFAERITIMSDGSPREERVSRPSGARLAITTDAVAEGHRPEIKRRASGSYKITD